MTLRHFGVVLLIGAALFLGSCGGGGGGGYNAPPPPPPPNLWDAMVWDQGSWG